MMNRRLFLSALGAVLLPARGITAPELVIDYESRNLKLRRTIAYVDGISEYSVKRAWIAGNTLELEVYNISWLTDANGRQIVEVETRQLNDGSRVPIMTRMSASQWILRTVDCCGKILSERSSR